MSTNRQEPGRILYSSVALTHTATVACYHGTQIVMASESESTHGDVHVPFESRLYWRRGGIAGGLAAVVMGAVIGVGDLAVLREAIAGLYLQSGSLATGVLAHVVHGTIFGILFAAVLSDPSLHRVTEWRWKTVLAGIVYSVALAVAGAGLIMPMWLDAVGTTPAPPLPNVSVPLLAWHLVYGLVLGVAFSVLDGRDRGG